MTERDFVHRGFGGVAVPGDIATGVVLVRSRAEADALAATWDGARLVADHYAFRVWTGRAGDVALTACSAGTGSASAAIAIEELAILGARTIVGLGAPWDAAAAGALLVAEGAVRLDAASHGYAREGYPAAADHEVVLAAVAAAREAGAPARRTIVADVEAEPRSLREAARRGADGARRAEAVIVATGAVPVHGSPAVLLVAGGIHGLRTGFLAAADAPETQARLRAIATSMLVRLARPAEDADRHR